MRGRRHLAVIIPVALLIAACGGDSDTSSSGTVAVAGVDDATTATTDEPADDTTTTTTTTIDTTTSTTTVTTTATTTTVVADSAQCVPGTWELRAQEFFDQIVAIGGVGGSMQHLGGRHLVVLQPDGTSEGRREAWSFEVASPEGGLITTVDATDTGTWAADGDTLTVTGEEQTFEASYEMMVGGVRTPFPIAPPNAVRSGPFSGAGPYTCEGDVLTITLTDAGITITNTWDRVAG